MMRGARIQCIRMVLKHAAGVNRRLSAVQMAWRDDRGAQEREIVATPGLRVLSAGAVKRGVALRASEFEKQQGCRLEIEFAIGPVVRERVLAGDALDVVVAPPAVMDEVARRGRVEAATRALVGRSRVGVFVRHGRALPDISSTDAFKRTVQQADAFVYNKASSGIYIGKLLERLGIAAEIRDKVILVDSGSAVMETVAADPRNAVGVGQISEIRVQIDKGTAITFVGPLPDAIQNLTTYEAAVATATGSPDAAAAFVSFLTSSEGRQVFAATGID
jgi:molybdate transport system substrate-binding protein